MRLIRCGLFVATLLAAFWADAAPRFLFSHYAPDESSLRLQVNGAILSNSLEFGETDTAYRLAEPGPLSLAVVNSDGEVLTGQTLDQTFNLERNDFSLIAYNTSDGEVGLEFLDDALVGRSDSPIQNAVVRTGSFARLSSSFLYGLSSELTTFSDGQVTSTSASFVQLGSGVGASEARVLGVGMDAAGAVSAASISLRVGTVSGDSESLQQVIFAVDADVSAGTSDLFVIGNGQQLPYRVVQRQRPGNRSGLESGLYGEPGLVGSGVQVVELTDEGRVYGLLYTYDDGGQPLWYYFDSTCEGLPTDPAYRDLACSDPMQAPVSQSVYSVSFYSAAGGALQPGVNASIAPSGFGRLNLRSLLDEGGQQFRTATMRVQIADLADLLATGASIPRGVRFVFEQLPGG